MAWQENRPERPHRPALLINDVLQKLVSQAVNAFVQCS